MRRYGRSLVVVAVGGVVAMLAPTAAWLPPSQAQSDGFWSQWPGPARDGVSAETDLLTGWPVSGPPRVWSTAGLGAGFSSVSVAGGRIFTMGDRPDGPYVVALDEVTGRRLWTTRIGNRHVDHFAGPRGTPTVDGDLLHGSALLERKATEGGGVIGAARYFLSPSVLQSHDGALVLIEGHLHCRYQNGVVALVEATPARYGVTRTFAIPNVRNPSWPHPVVAGGRLYLREQDVLHAYNVKS